MIGNLPDNLWDTIGIKKFSEDSKEWVLDGLDGDEAEIYRITVRQNNNSGKRDQIRINVNNDFREEQYEAVEAYMSADYGFGDRKLFTGLSSVVPSYEEFHSSVRDLVPDSKLWELVHPNWRVIRAKEMGYLTFGQPLSGANALFGQATFLASTGGPRSLIRMCAEKHSNGNLLTVGRYTYKETEKVVESLTFSSEYEGGIGEGSFIIVEGLKFPEEAILEDNRTRSK